MSRNRSSISVRRPTAPNPSQDPIAIHTSDYVDFDDEDLLNSIIDRIANQHQARHSSPTEKSFADSLPIIRLEGSPSKLSSRSCAICKDDFAVDEKINWLPCEHVFHRDCIIPWLNRSNTCPLCRYKLPAEKRPRTAPRQRRVRLENSHVEGSGENTGSSYDDVLLQDGYSVIRLPSISTSTSSFSVSSTMAQLRGGRRIIRVTRRRRSSAVTVEREVHVDVAANGGLNVMLDDDGDTVMPDA